MDLGERGNIIVKQSYPRDGDQYVWLYAHWSGPEIADIVSTVLARRQRWDDEVYLTRMLFCEMVRTDLAGETGFGISTYQQDNEYPLIVLDCKEQEIKVVEARFGSNAGPESDGQTFSFEEVATDSARFVRAFKILAGFDI